MIVNLHGGIHQGSSCTFETTIYYFAICLRQLLERYVVSCPMANAMLQYAQLNCVAWVQVLISPAEHDSIYF